MSIAKLAGRLGVSMQSVNDTLNDAFGQRQISTIYAQANQYRVILEAEPRYQQRPDVAVEALCHRLQHHDRHRGDRRQHAAGSTNTNTSARPTPSPAHQVPLSTFARFEHISAPLAIAHQEQFPSVTISFNLRRARR